MGRTEKPSYNPEGQKSSLSSLVILGIAISYIDSVLKYHSRRTLTIKDAKNLTRLEIKFGFLGIRFPLHGDNRRGY